MHTGSVSASWFSHWQKWVGQTRIVTTRVAAALLGGVALVTCHRWAEEGWMDYLLECSGLALVLLCLMGRSWCTLYIAGRKTRQLVTEGPYTLCRNPLYFFSALGALGVAAATETLTIVAIVAVLFALYYPTIIRQEEAVLRQVHGAAFEEYCRRVPAFFPRWPALRDFQESDTLTVNPRLFRKSLFSVIWFVIAFLVVHSLEHFHELGWLPVYFHWY